MKFWGKIKSWYIQTFVVTLQNKVMEMVKMPKVFIDSLKGTKNNFAITRLIGVMFQKSNDLENYDIYQLIKVMETDDNIHIAMLKLATGVCEWEVIVNPEAQVNDIYEIQDYAPLMYDARVTLVNT